MTAAIVIWGIWDHGAKQEAETECLKVIDIYGTPRSRLLP
jgi:hypothetical protein